jgi:lipopolysaccharide/colanic/teichoic acid biosynthesis glycosyltransferase
MFKLDNNSSPIKSRQFTGAPASPGGVTVKEKAPLQEPELEAKEEDIFTKAKNLLLQKGDFKSFNIKPKATMPSNQPKLRKVLFVGQNGKYICENMVELNYNGMSLTSASNAYQWLKEMAEQQKELPDVVICDLELPQGSPYALFDKLKSHPKLKEIPFIVISKNRNKINQYKALKKGFDDFYVQGVSAEEIHTRIEYIEKIKKEKLKTGFKAAEEVKFEPKMPIAKRALDIMVASILLLLLSPLFLVLAIIIKLESKGPVFYVAKRVGTGYNIFNFYKFRSMRTGADAELQKLIHLNQYNDGKGSFIKISNDPRVTRVGKLLRNTSIDELPQLFNVLIGDMSLVGNRPLPLYEAEQLTKDMWAKRFLAPAGITGLWQVTKRGRQKMSEEERMELDIAYADHYSFWMDIRILLKTIPALFQEEPV